MGNNNNTENKELEIIAGSFQNFMNHLHLGGVPPAQWDSMQMAFYAGATTVIESLKIVGSEDTPEENVIKILENIDNECEALRNNKKYQGKNS